MERNRQPSCSMLYACRSSLPACTSNYKRLRRDKTTQSSRSKIPPPCHRLGPERDPQNTTMIRPTQPKKRSGCALVVQALPSRLTLTRRHYPRMTKRIPNQKHPSGRCPPKARKLHRKTYVDLQNLLARTRWGYGLPSAIRPPDFPLWPPSHQPRRHPTRIV
jgi:hypothetical protein